MKTINFYLTVCALFLTQGVYAQSDSLSEKKPTVINGKKVKITLDAKMISEDSVNSFVIIHGDTATVMDDEINMDKKNIVSEKESDDKRNLSEWFNFDIGFNFLANNGLLDMPEAYKGLELENGKGLNFNLRIFEQSIDIIHKHLFLLYGAGIEWNNYRFKNNVDLIKDSTQLAYSISSNNYTKNKLVSTYITVPLMLKVRFKENKNGEAFQVTAGPQFGYLIHSYQKQKWEKDGAKNKQKTRGDFNLNEFRIGYSVYLEYRNVGFYARYYPEAAFKQGKGPDVNTVSIGLAFGGFNNYNTSF